jgi:translation elongation factor EF-G
MNRFEGLSKVVTVRVRAGSQQNCSGFAMIEVLAQPTTRAGIECVTTHSEQEFPVEFREATFAGMREAAAKGPLWGLPVQGVHLTVIRAWVHEVDANVRRFREAGVLALTRVLEQAPSLLEGDVAGPWQSLPASSWPERRQPSKP